MHNFKRTLCEQPEFTDQLNKAKFRILSVGKQAKAQILAFGEVGTGQE